MGQGSCGWKDTHGQKDRKAPSCIPQGGAELWSQGGIPHHTCLEWGHLYPYFHRENHLPPHMDTPSPDSRFGLVQASPHGSWVLAPFSFREKPHVPPALNVLDGSDQSLCSLWGTGQLDEPLPCRYLQGRPRTALWPPPASRVCGSEWLLHSLHICASLSLRKVICFLLSIQIGFPYIIGS